MDFLPDKYWYTAVPTHILDSLIVIFCTVKGFELIKTIETLNRERNEKGNRV